MSNDKVKFIRKNGRVIPVKDSNTHAGSEKLYAKSNKESSKSAKRVVISGLVGAGVGRVISKKFGVVSAIAGIMGMMIAPGARKLDKKSMKLKSKAGIMHDQETYKKRKSDYDRIAKLRGIRVKKKYSSDDLGEIERVYERSNK